MYYAHKYFKGSPLEVARQREKAMYLGLLRLAQKYNVTFKEPLTINALGEINLFLQNGCYGEELSKLISKHHPRTGIESTNYISPDNSWCMMNHFNVQDMLEEAKV